MKKLLLSLLVCVAGTFVASAQKAELQLGYGGYTQMDAMSMHPGGKVDAAWGALTAGVNFKVMPKVWVGPSYSFSSTQYKGSDLNAYYHVVMMNARYEYYSNSIVKLYAHFGIGADITHVSTDQSTVNKGYFAFQISPIGAEVDLGNRFKMFGEAGFGAQGLVQVGFRVNL